ncbi:alpha-L-rhamnosidase [Aquabacterium sp. OR-4]|uniref:alpha-L-rhamnosidase n=1 Tax=Aquabacterium sp. OR-4 TaxID=2978127 RepID=UPI0021B2A207|nr:alpha-L-rhamnosidase [Aquabacterium sp. OR-4]MDT7837929.1 family 78 glycoside hydrolase catalytic domain [Aquabacterium sp. OR-4]
MTQHTIDPTAACWLAAEDAAARAERQAGWHWAWGTLPAGVAQEPRLREFVWEFVLDAPLHEARLLIAAQKGLPAVWLDGQVLHESADMLSGRAMHDLALGTLAAGPHRLAAQVRVFHPFIAEPRQGGLAALLRGGGRFLSPQPADWRTRVGAPPGWHLAAPDAGWQTASAPAEPIDWLPMPAQPARLLRRRFTLPARPVSAMLTCTALGGCEAELNGQRVGDALLAPENSDFRHRLLVQQHEVAAQLQAGENALGVMVGDGFYASEAIGRGRYPFGGAPRRLWLTLDLTLPDGSTQRIATDGHWRASTAPVRFAEIYHGETYDARLEQAGWSSPGFDDSAWDEAWPAPAPACTLFVQESPPIRATLTLRPQAIQQPVPGQYVIDFGQNFAGWCRIRVRGEAGRTVTLRFAEILGDDGQVDMRNLRAARCTDHYTLRGDPAGETWQPRFTYHGFRYVQVSGWPSALDAGDIDGIVVHSDLPVTGHFESRQRILQGLWHNTFWSQRSNFVGMPTDCPQRDERLGWTGDAQVFWPTAAFNMDVRGFTRRFLADLRASQRADGAYADTNPPALPAYGAHGWSDAGVVLPHTVWQHYGLQAARPLIDEHWHSMERWMAWIAEPNGDGLWRARREVDFGDWLSLDAVSLMDETTPKLLSATACWGRMLGMMADMATATGRHERAAHFMAWRERVAGAFAASFIQPDGRIGNGSHTGYILPLAFGLVPPALRQAAADQLAAAIRARGTLLSTGFLGTPFSLDVLADHGHGALAVELLLRTEFPSWGYMVERGATTIWERWNGDTGDLAMNSFNHYALGAITGFLYRRVAGLASAAPGFESLLCRPLADARLGEGSARIDTVHGPVGSRWGVGAAGAPWFQLTLPEGMPATVLWQGQAVMLHRPGLHRFGAHVLLSHAAD